MDINELLASARLPEKEVQICLRTDLLADFETAEAALDAAIAAAEANGSVAAGTGKVTAAQRVADLRQRMLDASLTFRLRAVPRRRWTALLAENPPREGNLRDRASGFNNDTFFERLARVCVVDPVMTDAQWEQLLDHMSAGQYDALTMAAWDVNRQGVDVPFSSAASLALTSTEPESERPEGSESLSNALTAGNPPPSTPTTTAAGSSPPARKRSGTKNSKH